MAGEVCRNCGETTVTTDAVSGYRVCESCSCVLDSSIFQHQEFDSDGKSLGTLLHSAGEFGYREQKLYRARASITNLTSLLGLSATHADDVTRLASQATDDELGSGDWFPILVAACAIIVRRQHRSPLSLTEAAAVIGRHPRDLGRMVVRVAQHLDLGQLPDLDSVSLLERFAKNSPLFSDLEEQKFEEILGQGRFIFHCAMRWFLTTGRHPLPLITAVLTFVANVNGLKVGVEEIAAETLSGVVTSRIRLKELMEMLVKVSRTLLPWGKDVTVKNILLHAPVLIRFMELKSKSKSNPVGGDNGCLPNLGIDLGDILSSYSEHIDVAQEESRYFRLGEGAGTDSRLDGDVLDSLKLSEETTSLSQAYRKVLDTLPEICNELKIDNIYGSKKRGAGLEIEDWIESWEGRWKSDKGLTLKQVLQRSEGYDALPPSFIEGLDMRMKRRKKMEAAKLRILDVMKRAPGKNEVTPNKGEVSRLTELPLSSKRRKRRKRGGVIDELDWEDCIIELLLLHQADEEEIEQGHYNRLLELIVFSSTA